MSATDLYDDEHIDYSTDPEPIDGRDAAALAKANWHMRVAGSLADELDDLNVVYGNEIKRLNARLDARAGKIASRIAWHLTPVKQLHAVIVADDPRRKTIELPNGTMSATVPVKALIEIVDPEAVQAWALSNMPDSCPPKQIGVRDLRNALVITKSGAVLDPATAEIVPGVAAIVPAPTFRVTPPKPTEFETPTETEDDPS